MHIFVLKEKRELYLLDDVKTLLRAPVGLGRVPKGAKNREGDGKTPEGTYAICLIKANGKYGRSLGLNYPNLADAQAALHENTIDMITYQAIANAIREGRRPPWSTALGGEIFIHEGGAHKDWTQGCIALHPKDMDILYPYCQEIMHVKICP